MSIRMLKEAQSRMNVLQQYQQGCALTTEMMAEGGWKKHNLAECASVKSDICVGIYYLPFFEKSMSSNVSAVRT